MDIYKRIANLSNERAKVASDGLEKLADEQEKKIEDKKKLRDLKGKVDSILSRGGVNLAELDALASELAKYDTSIAAEVANFEKIVTDSGKSATGAENRAKGVVWFAPVADKDWDEVRRGHLDKIKSKIDDAEKNVTDSESLVNFRIQLGMSDLTSAEQARAGAIKRLSDQRDSLIQKWTA